MTLRPPARSLDAATPHRWVVVAAVACGVVAPLALAVLALSSGITAAETVTVVQPNAQDELSGRIAYVRADDSQWDVYAADPDGANEARVNDTDAELGHDQDPRYSPDGQDIAYHTFDGRRLIVWRVPFAGGTPTPVVTDTTTGYMSGFVAWQPPSGECLVYAGARAGTLGDTDLKRWCEDTGTTTLLGTEDRNESGSDWSPDGSRLAYEAEPVDRDEGDEHWEIRVVDADGTNDRPLIQQSGTSERHPRWSPDGASLAYVQFGGKEGRGRGILAVKDIDTGVETFLVDGVAGPATWSPDGRKLIFTGILDGGPVPLGGLGPVVPVPSPGSETKGLYRLDLDTGIVHRVGGYAGGAIATPGKYEWGYSPDWTGGTYTPTPPPTDTPTTTPSPTITPSPTATRTPSRLVAFVPIAAKSHPPAPTATATDELTPTPDATAGPDVTPTPDGTGVPSRTPESSGPQPFPSATP